MQCSDETHHPRRRTTVECRGGTIRSIPTSFPLVRLPPDHSIRNPPAALRSASSLPPPMPSAVAGGSGLLRFDRANASTLGGTTDVKHERGCTASNATGLVTTGAASDLCVAANGLL